MTTQGIEQEVGATLVAVRNGPGARLRAAREALGWTTLEVAQQLRFSTDVIIVALEKDQYDPNTPLVFIKGYLRSYASLVRIDREQVINEFEHLGVNDPVRDAPGLGQGPQSRLSSFEASRAPKHRPGLLWGSLALFVCGMLVFMWSYRDQLPALNTPSSTTVSEASSTEETELNAALEAAREANAQATPATADATPITAPAMTAPTITSTAPDAAATKVNEAEKTPAVKPVSTNDIVVPATREAAKPPVKRAVKTNTHETMLF